MVENLNKELIIYSSSTRFVNIRKRYIIKLSNHKFKVITHYKENGVYKVFVCKEEFNKEQIEELIQAYLDEFGFEKSVFYK